MDAKGAARGNELRVGREIGRSKKEIKQKRQKQWVCKRLGKWGVAIHRLVRGQGKRRTDKRCKEIQQ